MMYFLTETMLLLFTKTKLAHYLSNILGIKKGSFNWYGWLYCQIQCIIIAIPTAVLTYEHTMIHYNAWWIFFVSPFVLTPIAFLLPKAKRERSSAKISPPSTPTTTADEQSTEEQTPDKRTKKTQ